MAPCGHLVRRGFGVIRQTAGNCKFSLIVGSILNMRINLGTFGWVERMELGARAVLVRMKSSFILTASITINNLEFPTGLLRLYTKGRTGPFGLAA